MSGLVSRTLTEDEVTVEDRHAALRETMLAGGPARIEFSTRTLLTDDSRLVARCAVEVFTLTDRGSWRRKPDLILFANTENGPDDHTHALGGLFRWLEAGRQAVTS